MKYPFYKLFPILGGEFTSFLQKWNFFTYLRFQLANSLDFEATLVTETVFQ